MGLNEAKLFRRICSERSSPSNDYWCCIFAIIRLIKVNCLAGGKFHRGECQPQNERSNWSWLQLLFPPFFFFFFFSPTRFFPLSKMSQISWKWNKKESLGKKGWEQKLQLLLSKLGYLYLLICNLRVSKMLRFIEMNNSSLCYWELACRVH